MGSRSLFETLFKIAEGVNNVAKGKGYVSNDYDPHPIRNTPQDGSMKYLIEGTAHDGRAYRTYFKEKFVVFADSPLEAKQRFEAMFRQMHDWSKDFSCAILKSWPTHRR